jgi:hypothetical protein
MREPEQALAPTVRSSHRMHLRVGATIALLLSVTGCGSQSQAVPDAASQLRAALIRVTVALRAGNARELCANEVVVGARRIWSERECIRLVGSRLTPIRQLGPPRLSHIMVRAVTATAVVRQRVGVTETRRLAKFRLVGGRWRVQVAPEVTTIS